MSIPKLFVFDFGDVIERDSTLWADLFGSLGFTPQNVRKFGPHASEAVTKMMVGAIEEPEFWRLVQMDLGTTFPCAALLYEKYHCEEVPGTRDIVRELSEKDHRVVCGTNNIQPFFRKIRDQHKYDVFWKVYSSYKMGLAKPDPAFWQYIAEQEKVRCSEMYFIDDRDENIAAARSLGIASHHFSTAERLRAELVELGILDS